jgi:hypothetical protein
MALKKLPKSVDSQRAFHIAKHGPLHHNRLDGPLLEQSRPNLKISRRQARNAIRRKEKKPRASKRRV